jgi:hypothetical protein
MRFLDTRPGTHLPITELKFCVWLGSAAPDDALEYHRGVLAADVNPQATRLNDRERAELARVASRARWASGRGLVHLVQRRYGPGDYSYIAILRHRPNRIRVSFSPVFEANAGKQSAAVPEKACSNAE